MNKESFKKISRRLVVELAIVVAVVSYKVHFPKGKSIAENWEFVFNNPLILFHVILSTLILIEAVILLVRSLRSRNRFMTILSSIGFAFIMLAYIAGERYVATRQFLGLMSLGWFGAILTYGIGWFLSRNKAQV